MVDDTTRYPVFLTLTGRLAVVVGGDAVARRKVSQFVRCGADVVVITPFPGEELRQLEADGVITMERRGYVRGDLKGAFLVYATETDEIAGALFAEAETLGCLVNVAHDSEHSNYLVPSSVRRGRLHIAISTGGTVPAVTKRLRRELSARFGEEWEPYIELLSGVRALAIEQIDDPEQRARIIEASTDERTAWDCANTKGMDFLDRLGAGEELTPELVLAELLADDAAAEGIVAETPDESNANQSDPSSEG